MIRSKSISLTAGSAAIAIIVLAACNSGDSADRSTGGGSSDGGFTDVTSEVASWDMCEVLSPEPLLEKVNSVGYTDARFEPTHIGLGSAKNAEAISCHAMFDVALTDEDATRTFDVTLSVFPGKSEEHVDDMWDIRLNGWYRDNVEAELHGYTADDLFLDGEIDGPWDRGHAYALVGNEGAVAGESGSALINVRTDNFMVEIFIHVPTDPAKSQAARYQLDQAEIDARTSLDFSRQEFVEWLADDHIRTMFDAVNSRLENA